MFEDVGAKVKFPGVRDGFPDHALELIHVHMVRLNKENKILVVGNCAAVQFAESNAVRVGNVDLQISELTDADDAFFVPFWQRDESFKRDWFDMDFQFSRNLHDGFMQRVWVNIVADEVNINRQARAAEQSQRASANQDQSRGRRAARSHVLQDGLNFPIVHELSLSELQPFSPHLFSALVGGKPVNVRAAQFLVTFCQRAQVFFRVVNELQVQVFGEMIGQGWSVPLVFFGKPDRRAVITWQGEPS